VQETRRLLHADACALLLPGADAIFLEVRAASGWRGDPVAERRRFRRDGGPGTAMQSGRPCQVDEAEAAGAQSGDAFGWRAEGFRSLAFVPLMGEGRAIGVLVLSNREARRLDDEELRFVRLLANQAALLVEQARLRETEREQQGLEDDLAVARQIQLSLLPAGCPQVAGWEFAAAYQSARQVGGDLYDFVELPGAGGAAGARAAGKIGLLVADVSGKGASAALFMAYSRAVIRAAALRHASPAQVLSQANELLQKDNQASLFVSAFYAVVDAATGVVTYANAGHNRPLWWQAASGLVRDLSGHGLVLGVKAGFSYHDEQLQLGPGDLLVLYTDGITEALDAHDELFGSDRLCRTVAAAAPGAGPQLVIDAVLAAVRAFSGGTPQADDYTLVGIRRCNGREPS
jgi:sigma-B regulation protein RsbU (phosphoserine phosphatase)